ncbi:MAG: M24 family metallopeptidase [Salinirussus sp.]
MSSPPEFDAAVRDRLDRYLDREGLAAVWFARSSNFAWVTGGDNVVDRAEEPGAAAAGYDGDRLRVVTSGIEADRLRVEELPDGTAVESYPWYEKGLAGAVATASPEPAAADIPIEGFERVDAARLRLPLTDRDVERYRSLGRDAAGAVEAVCREVTPATTERSTAGDLAGRLAAAGIDAPVVLVGGGRRAREYRHYTPSEAQLGDYALVSVTARRQGLFASCTRTVAFDPPSWLTDRHEAAARVETTALEATRHAGRRGDAAGDVFAGIQSAYAALGYDGEWREHHQGGATGHASREWIATPDHEAPVELPGAYAWNPTIQGAKSEDTVLVTDDGFDVLTTTDGWPTVETTAVDGATTLRRPAVLER